MLSKGYGQGAQLFGVSRQGEKWRTEIVWSNPRVLKTKFSNVAVKDGFAYGLSDGILECIELESGDRRWKSGRYGHGQILLTGDLLLVQAETGELVLVAADPDRRIELTQIDVLTGKCWNNLCLSGNRLLLRNAQEAVCYELPLK